MTDTLKVSEKTPIMVTQAARELVAAVVRSAYLRGQMGEGKYEMCAPEVQDAALSYIAGLEQTQRNFDLIVTRGSFSVEAPRE